MFGDLILPEICPLVKLEMVISGDGGALPTCVATPATGLTARRGTHVLLQPDGRRD